ncbi:MAG TPA: chloride channel protein, partial [Noviherbaspirillum sp.]
MKNSKHPEQIDLLPYMGKWLILAVIVAILAGTASALFLFSLEWATAWRESHAWIIWLLPLAGFAVGWIYHCLGKDVEAGNNLIIDEIHDPKKVIPLRMAPLVLGGTVISHLFGASVGREGTAVQMGSALADQLTHIFRMDQQKRRLLIMAGMSAGFSSVFGTPLAGAIFGLEVLSIGRMRYDAILPCFVAAIVADQVGLLWGIQH